MKNLKLLFADVTDVVIDDRGSIKYWINEASEEQYWNQLVKRLLDRDTDLPERPAEWTHRRRSPRNQKHPGIPGRNHGLKNLSAGSHPRLKSQNETIGPED